MQISVIVVNSSRSRRRSQVHRPVQCVKGYNAETANAIGAGGTAQHLDQSGNTWKDFEENTHLNEVLGEEHTEGRYARVEDMDSVGTADVKS